MFRTRSGKPVQKVTKQIGIHPTGVDGRQSSYFEGPILPSTGNRRRVARRFVPSSLPAHFSILAG
jgi:hypothetical protein